MTQVKTRTKDGIVTQESDKPYFFKKNKLCFVDFSETTAYHNFCTITFENNKQKDFIVNIKDVKHE